MDGDVRASDEDDYDRRVSRDDLSDLVGGDAFPFRGRRPYRMEEEVLTLEPPRQRCMLCERGDKHPGWKLFVGGQFVCDSPAVAGLCAAARARPAVWTKPRIWYDSFMSSECFMDFVDEVNLSADGMLCVYVSEKATVEIPAREIAARLDEWTPLWWLSQRPAIDAAEAPPDEGV